MALAGKKMITRLERFPESLLRLGRWGVIHGAHNAALTYPCATGRANGDAMSQQSIQDGLFIYEMISFAFECDLRHGVAGLA